MKYKLFNFFQLIIFYIFAFFIYILKFNSKIIGWVLFSFGLLLLLYSFWGGPKSCVRNIWGFLEIHIGSDFKNKRDFYCKVAESILYAYSIKKEVLICTCAVREQHIKCYFGSSVTFYQLSTFDKIFYRLNNLWYKVFRKISFKYPVIKFVIDYSKLLPEQIVLLQNFVNGNSKYCNICTK